MIRCVRELTQMTQMTNDQSVNPVDILWSGNSAKRAADDTMYRAMAFDLLNLQRGGKRRLRVLSFPAQTWAWEQRLEETFPQLQMEFIGLERDVSVFRKTKKFAAGFSKRYAMTDKPCDFQSFAANNRLRRPFDIVYLDWMGTWSREKKDDISALFKGEMLSVGGLLIVTVSLRRGRPETIEELTDLSHDLPLAFYDARGEDKYVRSLKVRGIPHWIQNYAIENHIISMTPLLASVYYSRTGLSNQTQPQLQIMMRRDA